MKIHGKVAYSPKQKWWTQKNGVKVHREAMTDSHVLNALHMLCRHMGNIRSTTPYPNFIGEMAQWHAECEYEHMMNTSVLELVEDAYPDMYEMLMHEIFKRDLYNKIKQEYK